MGDNGIVMIVAWGEPEGHLSGGENRRRVSGY